MPTWPASLPQKPLLTGFQIAAQSMVIAFGTEVGPGKIRRRTTARVAGLPFSFHVNATKLATFIDFFEDDLEDGALAFDMTDPVVGGTASFRIAPSDPPYVASVVGNNLWLVSLQLQRLP